MTENAPRPAEPPKRPPAPPAPPPPRAEAPKPVPPPPATPGSRLLPLVVVGFVATAVGGYWLWQQQEVLAAHVQPATPTVDPGRVAALEGQLGVLQQRLAQLEQRPAATPAPVADLRPLEARIGQVSAKLDALQGSDSGAVKDLATKLEAFEQRIGEAEQREQAITARTGRSSRVQVAGAALEAGQPLGDIPGAPPALAKFGYANPPTVAGLRLSFPTAASAAEQASDPATAGLSLPERMWQQVQALVTIRQGEKVLIGAPASHVLSQARAKLEAGDLAGAVAALDQLDPAAAQAMAGWRGQAQSLLDARAALAAMARS